MLGAHDCSFLLLSSLPDIGPRLNDLCQTFVETRMLLSPSMKRKQWLRSSQSITVGKGRSGLVVDDIARRDRRNPRRRSQVLCQHIFRKAAANRCIYIYADTVPLSHGYHVAPPSPSRHRPAACSGLRNAHHIAATRCRRAQLRNDTAATPDSRILEGSSSIPSLSRGGGRGGILRATSPWEAQRSESEAVLRNQSQRQLVRQGCVAAPLCLRGWFDV